MEKRSRPVGAFIGMIVFSFVLYYVMYYLQDNVLTASLIPDYVEMESGFAEGSVFSWILWVLGDMTEANFYKSYLGGIGLIAGSLIAHYLYKKNSKHQGIAIAYGSGIWPWVLGASCLSLVVSNLVYGWNVAESGWFPTFVVFVSVPAATMLVYGKGMKNLLTGALAAVVLVVPLSRLFMVYIAAPIGLPGVSGSVFGMWAGGVVAFEMYRLLPWMKLPEPPKPEDEDVDSPKIPEYKHLHPSKFYLRRIVADFSEPCFAGNEIAGAGLLIGTVLSWLLCSTLPVYGSGTFPAVLFAEFLTGALAVFIYWDDVMERAWFPSFPSMVSVAPGVAWLYEGSIWPCVLAAVFGAFICPAMTDFVIRKLPPHWPTVIGTTFSMTVGTVIVGMFLICVKGIIPGM